MKVEEIIEQFQAVTLNATIAISIEQQTEHALIALETLNNYYQITKSDRIKSNLIKLKNKINEMENNFK